MISTQQRVDYIHTRIEELYDILNEWDEQHDLASDNPTQRARCKKEMTRIREQIEEYKAELNGETTASEDPENPIRTPEEVARELNRKWIISVIVSVIILIGGFQAYTYFTKVEPDYQSYFAYMSQGDSAMVAKDFKEARKAYKTALEYFPEDSFAMKKLALLDEADSLVNAKNFEAATSRFELILEIPLASQTAFNLSQEESGSSNNSLSDSATGNTMRISITWQNGVLMIKVTGGTPFDDPNKPYELGGINYCPTCLAWEKEPDGFVAKISNLGSDIKLTITIRDKRGQRLDRNYQTGKNPDSENGNPEIPPEKLLAEPEIEKLTPEQMYDNAIVLADSLFEKKEYKRAMASYNTALKHKPSDNHSTKRIDECLAELKKAAIALVALKRLSGNSFNMGDTTGRTDAQPIHLVNLPSFSISKTEITVAQYQAYCELTGKSLPPGNTKASHPVVNVSWQDAVDYCKWAGGRLPTEAEWEFTAKAGKNTKYSGSNVVKDVAWYKDNASGTYPAISKKANAFGLYGMTGNVAEWCSDWYGRKYYGSSPASNPKGPSKGSRRVIRGGGFTNAITKEEDQLAIIYRNHRPPGESGNWLGFRMVK